MSEQKDQPFSFFFHITLVSAVAMAAALIASLAGYKLVMKTPRDYLFVGHAIFILVWVASIIGSTIELNMSTVSEERRKKVAADRIAKLATIGALLVLFGFWPENSNIFILIGLAIGIPASIAMNTGSKKNNDPLGMRPKKRK